MCFASQTLKPGYGRGYYDEIDQSREPTILISKMIVTNRNSHRQYLNAWSPLQTFVHFINSDSQQR